MTDNQIKQLAIKFRKAIEIAHQKGLFTHDIALDDFPTGSCGDVSYLLAEYLKRSGIETIWYSAQRGDWSHAWLVVKDGRVHEPTPRMFSWPDELRSVVARYGVKHPEEEVELRNYEAEDLKDGLMVDITADQFDDYDIPVYVGGMDAFHRTFEFRQAHDYDGLVGDGRLVRLYETIEKYL